nr:MAG TPA: hypothetical protein [Caudoviricetes sp.]
MFKIFLILNFRENIIAWIVVAINRIHVHYRDG